MGWGLEVRYDYRITPPLGPTSGPTGAPCEVAVEVAPIGIRHAIANIFSMGRGAAPYLAAATQGLANLKESAEADPQSGRPST